MNGDTMGAIELVLIFGPILGFAVWELVRLNRGSQQPLAERKPALDDPDIPAGTG